MDYTILTTTHLVLMALLGGAAIATIWWGTVLRARRKAARAQVEADYEIAKEHGAIAEPSAVTSEGTPILSADVPEEPAPAPPPTDLPATPAPETQSAPSDLTRLKGLGPKLADTLATLGITRIGQIAALSPAEAEALDARLGAFQGRLTRDRWIEQARLLEAGDVAGYEAAFGKI